MARKDYQSAIVYLSIYIQGKPKKYEAYQLRGECFYELRQYKLAQMDFEKAIELKTADDKFITGTKVLGAVVLGADKQSQYQNPELGKMYAQLMYSQKAQNNVAYEASYQKAFEYNSHIYLPQPIKKDIAKINCPQKYGKKINVTGVDEYITDAINLIEKGQFNEAVYKTQYITSNYPKYYLINKACNHSNCTLIFFAKITLKALVVFKQKAHIVNKKNTHHTSHKSKI